MGADWIEDKDLLNLGIDIVEETDSGSRKIMIPSEGVEEYKKLIKEKMSNGFWNEFLDENNIHFIFKFKNGDIKEYILSPENEHEIGKLCAEFSNEPPNETANVYKYISENAFYHDFMMGHYKEMVEREVDTGDFSP